MSSRPFKVHAPYQPAGDQPAAIDRLVSGIEAGVASQVVLGVTGSGKSVVGSTKVILKSKGRHYHIRADSLDTMFSDPTLDSVDLECVPIQDRLGAVALDVAKGRVLLGNVKEISRHRYRGPLYTIVAEDGRSNTFTDSHNVYVIRSGRLMLCKSEDLRVGDCVPVPLELGIPDDMRHLDVLDLSEWVNDKKSRINLPSEYSIPPGILSREKEYRVKRFGEAVSIDQYRKLNKLSPVGMARIGRGQKAGSLPCQLKVDKTLLRLIGWFISEGCYTPGYIIISTAEESVKREIEEAAKGLGLSFRRRGRDSSYDYGINGKTIASLMKSWGGAGAAGKHLPAFWPQLDDVQLGWLLSAIFAGDGCVEKDKVTLSSVSQELLSDVQTALARFGVLARVRSKFVLYKGARRPSYVLSVSGQSNCLRFRDFVGFGLDRKDALLDALCRRKIKANTNVDVLPLPTDLISRVMSGAGVFQREVAAAVDVERSLVSMYVSGSRRPCRKKARRLAIFLSEKAESAGLEDEAQELKAYADLTQTAWMPIKTIKKDEADTLVYDLSVPECETFLANGFFVHNTHTVARVIERVQLPTLVMAPNKTLAAQLYGEFKSFFPDNAVEYFVSYYDYYQPEAYIPSSDTFVEKDSAINEQIEQMRLSATKSLLDRRDTIVVASVSAIYGLGDPAEFHKMAMQLRVGQKIGQREILARLTEIQYARNDVELKRGTFRVRGETIDVFPAEHDQHAVRFLLFDGEVEAIAMLDPLTGKLGKSLPAYTLFPKSHYVTTRQRTIDAMESIKQELRERLAELTEQNKLVEAQRLAQRTQFDLEMMAEVGYCNGIENYSRHLTGMAPGQPPPTLFSYLPPDAFLVIDESHVTVPQIGGMAKADKSRKQTLVDFGFRLPSAKDNRPLRFEEWEERIPRAVYVSATPGPYELGKTAPEDIVELVARPTGLLDPVVEVRPVATQVDDLLSEVKQRVEWGDRVLVTTLTKKMAENLTDYLAEHGIKVRYLHSDVETLERSEILRDLRLGAFDVLVGINLLREGLDLPEVSLVAILDADKEGFLRSANSLIQTIGRAARNVRGKAILYADRITKSMDAAMSETARRRERQEAHNAEQGITPQSIQRRVADIMETMRPIDEAKPSGAKRGKGKKGVPAEMDDISSWSPSKIGRELERLEKLMLQHAQNLEFEQAAAVRDEVGRLKAHLLLFEPS